MLDLRTVKKGCKKIEKDNLQAQEIQDDTFTVRVTAGSCVDEQCWSVRRPLKAYWS